MDIAFEKYLKNTCVQLMFTSNIKINMQITRSLGKQTRLNLCKPRGKKILNVLNKPNCHSVFKSTRQTFNMLNSAYAMLHLVYAHDWYDMSYFVWIFFSTWVMRFLDYQNNYILVALIWQFMSECVIKGNNSCTSAYFWFHGSIGSFLTDV